MVADDARPDADSTIKQICSYRLTRSDKIVWNQDRKTAFVLGVNYDQTDL